MLSVTGTVTHVLTSCATGLLCLPHNTHKYAQRNRITDNLLKNATTPMKQTVGHFVTYDPRNQWLNMGGHLDHGGSSDFQRFDFWGGE